MKKETDSNAAKLEMPCPFCRTPVTMERAGGGPGGGTEKWLWTCPGEQCRTAGRTVSVYETPNFFTTHDDWSVAIPLDEDMGELRVTFEKLSEMYRRAIYHLKHISERRYKKENQ